MNLQYDRRLTISIGNSRKDMSWKAQTLSIGELWEKLRIPVRGTETVVQYMKLKKAQQDELKDVGGFVAGTLKGARRKAANITGRDVVTLDFDTVPAYGTEGLIESVRKMGCAFAVYSTRKHIETAPRLRILFPIDRTVTADEYEPIARWMAQQIGIQMADPTTFEPSRLMFWPSCCVDSEYVFEYQDAPLFSADMVLATYADWRDFSSWPQVPGAISYQKLAMKQGDPDTKPGVVGAFNRAYDNVYNVLEKVLPGIYAPVDGDDSRFTYLNGSTTGGAVVYDHGKFLYSHHATDPCSGKLVNCFDLVRLHKFGDKDDSVQPGTPNNRLPSYTAMCEFAVADPACSALMAKERREQAVKDFEGVTAQPAAGEESEDPDSIEWMQRLDINKKSGQIKDTIVDVQNAFDGMVDQSGSLLHFMTDTVAPDYDAFVNVSKQYGEDAKTIESFSNDIAEMASNIGKIIQEVSQAIGNIAESSQNTVEHSHQIIQSVGSVSGIVDHIGDMSIEQQKIAGELKGVVNKFQL